ncbi:diguanylate cyclase domain-containing protein [Cohnella soli]|uniref:Diguanylate cyclase domain-containing protein n=1 Tax=Cohnella soli TaxID=425005 RepID=A0ABW0HY19_9BACL
MDIQNAFILMFTHGLPILFLAYMATDVLLRNKKSVEHILISVISLCYLLLFAEEYLRNQVSIAYSPILSAAWLSSVGIVITSVCFHFLIRFTRTDVRMPRWLYPYGLYLPVVFVIVNLATGAELISAQQFVEAGMWKVPVYNAGYMIALASSVGVEILFLLPLMIARTKTGTLEQKSIYKQLTIAVCVSISWNIVFGFINYGGYLPPYPYLYAGIIWCYVLRRTMKRYDFLTQYDKRFQQLFDMHPDAFLLVDRSNTVKHANPGAKRLFDSLGLDFVRFFELLEPETKQSIHSQTQVKQHETEIEFNGTRLVLLVNADYIWVENENHTLLILQDITVQKQQQKEIQFLAYHDPLTRLPNRRFFQEKLDKVLQEAERRGESVALLLVDLNKFKLLNDTHGHLAGDEALQQAAQIIQDCVGNHGAAARVGGDEFILYIERSPSLHEVERIVDEMKKRFSRYISKFGSIPVGMSIGTSYFPEDGNDGQALMHKADSAMYVMKRSRV